ncbi:MAG: nuclear transport factor 2 family protein [Gammaproteobacteria bacterium]|jgi:hypothetical protein
MNPDRAFIECFKAYFRGLHQSDPSQLQSLYADEVVYRGPVQQLRGLVELEDYYASLIGNFSHCRYEFLDEIIGEQTACLKWVLHLDHPRLRKRSFCLRGVSQLKWTDRIRYQEDFYDSDALLREQLPILGNVTRWLKLRLAS